jgi:hypothetical protein
MISDLQPARVYWFEKEKAGFAHRQIVPPNEAYVVMKWRRQMGRFRGRLTRVMHHGS